MDDLPKFGKRPISIRCPGCGNNITTRTIVKSTVKTHMIAATLAMLCLFFIAPFVYCSRCCRSVLHFCPTCGRFLGIYNG